MGDGTYRLAGVEAGDGPTSAICHSRRPTLFLKQWGTESFPKKRWNRRTFRSKRLNSESVRMSSILARRPAKIRKDTMAKILIVDDSKFARLNCKKVLVQRGHEVLEASSGSEAVALYKSYGPDMVFLDITMPDMDGLTALEEIRKYDSEARVAMATAMGQQTVVMQALKSGAKDFLVKPFEPERILGTVEKLLG